MTIEQEREKFEEWFAQECGKFLGWNQRRGNGYMLNLTNLSWLAWLARKELISQCCRECGDFDPEHKCVCWNDE